MNAFTPMECSCGLIVVSGDYLCRRCREKADSTQHPMVGQTIVDVEIKDGMGGTHITLADGSIFVSLYSRYETTS